MRPLFKFVTLSTCSTFLLAAMIMLAPSTAVAGGGPENVILVVNANSASSKMIANHYIFGRNIPTRNVIYLNDVPAGETTDLAQFKEKILKPILHEIEIRKLVQSVDYIVYSSDFPTMINNKVHVNKLKKKVKDETGRNIQAKLFTGNVSINSLTYYALAVMLDEPGYMTLDSNAYYRNRSLVLLRRPFSGDRQVEFQNAIKKIGSENESDLDDAIVTLEEMAKLNPRQIAVAYWLAKFYGKQGDAKNATTWLTRAVRLGWSYKQQTLADLAFEKVKDDPLFKGFAERIPDQAFDFVPTHGFKHRYSWGGNGMLNNEPGQGNRHFLSTVLAVTRNHGTNEKEALRQLKLSMAADESHPDGTFYFADTKDVRNRTRKPNYAAAISALNKMGHLAEIITTKMPIKARDVIGLTCGTASFNWTTTGSKIIPGAICDNLTSFGGALHRSGQTKISEFILKGAAGASGTVVEPYAIQAKFPHPMVHVHYARGCSLAESFYQSVHGPAQLLIVGDALCQPWATKPVVLVTGVAAGDTVKGKIDLQLDADNSPVSIVGLELYVDGVLVHRMPFRNNISFDTSRMTDGHHEIRIVSVANNLIESTGSVVLPVKINNKGISTELTTQYADYLITDEISFKAKSNYGSSIELMHNGRSIAKKIGRDVEFKISAKILGRGPVKLEAISISESGNAVASMPIEIQVDGRISQRKINTEKKPAPKKKSATPAE